MFTIFYLFIFGLEKWLLHFSRHLFILFVLCGSRWRSGWTSRGCELMFKTRVHNFLSFYFLAGKVAFALFKTFFQIICTLWLEMKIGMERVGSSQGSAGSCGELQVGNRLCLHHDVMQHKPTYLYKVPQKLDYMVGLMLVQGIKTVSKYIRFVITIIMEEGTTLHR